MISTLEPLVLQALAEITRRDPTFRSIYRLDLADSAVYAFWCERCGSAVPFEDFRRAVEALRRAARERGFEVGGTREVLDPIARVLVESVADSSRRAPVVAELHDPALDAPPDIRTVLDRSYHLKTTRLGSSYVVSKEDGENTLVLINSLGVPLQLWRRFLGGAERKFKVIIPMLGCRDWLAGGMESGAPLTEHAESIEDILDEGDVDRCIAVGWCNGGRVAVELARRATDRIRGLVLMGPTFRRSGDEGSKFERNLDRVFSLSARNSALSGPLSILLRSLQSPPDLKRDADDLEKTASLLFAMPAVEDAGALLAPMAKPEYLINYAKRSSADERHELSAALTSIKDIPLLLLTGRHDSIVDNALTRNVLRTADVPFIEVEVSGGGHYLQDLQYPYFSWLMKTFASDLGIVDAHCRLKVH